MTTRPLAQVELQLVMRMCERQSLLLFARCSKETLRASMSDFAWSALSPIIFRSTRPQLGPRLSSSLLRHADIGVRWCDSHLCWQLAREIASLASVPRLRLLDARSDILCASDLEALLQSPAFDAAHLTSLLLGQSLSKSTIPLLAERCPSLRSLRAVLPWNLANLYVEKLAELLPNLTEIDLESGGTYPLALQPLMSYAMDGGLKKLALRGFATVSWQPLLESPNMRSLQEMTLDRARFPEADGVAPWAACFSNLVSLRRFTLEHCSPMGCILTALIEHASPTLRSLDVSMSTASLTAGPTDQPGEVASEAAASSSAVVAAPAPAPVSALASSIALLQRLLQQRPECDLTLHFPPRAQFVTERKGFMAIDVTDGEGDEIVAEEEWHDSNDVRSAKAAKTAAVEWDEIHAAYTALQSAHPLRVWLSCSGPPPLADAPPVLAAASSSMRSH